MQIETNITRKDLLHFNSSLLLKLSSTYKTLAIISITVFILMLYLNGVPVSGSEWLILILASIGGGIGGVTGAFAANMLSILLSADVSNGSIGKHTYELRDEGLYELTSVNEGVTKWEGIHSIVLSGPFILFKISGFLYHIIPKRSFSSEQDFEAFYNEAMSKWKRKVK